MTYATFSQRLLAHNIDLLPLLLAFYLINYLETSKAYDWILYFLSYFLYHLLFELSQWKATPGKKWCGLTIYNETSKKNIELRIIIRNITKPISLFLFFSGFFLILFHSKRQSLHDVLAGTLVIKE